MTTKTIEAPAVEAPAESPPKPLKLSEALRLGSIATVQAHGDWSKTDPAGGGKAMMCAISTAWYALTGLDEGAAISGLVDLLGNVRVTNPASGGTGDVASVIINLNDHYKWSRPQIADWLEELGL